MKRVIIPARPDHTDRKKRFSLEIAVVLGDAIEAKYEVVAKDFPEDLPEFWVDPDDQRKKKIEWLSNFGLRGSNGKFVNELPKGQRYQIELPAQPGKIVYFDGERIRRLPGMVQGKKFVAALNLGDPPIGRTAG